MEPPSFLLEGLEVNSRQRRICAIAFEEYLYIWKKIATTNPDILMESEYLNELVRYKKTCTPHCSTGSETDCLSQVQHVIPVQKFSKKHTLLKSSRVERMRRIYMQCKAPELLIPQIPHSAQGSDVKEHWEKEMDELVEWTQSLSL